MGILDVDLTGPSIPRLVGQEDAKITQAPGGWVPVSVYPASTATATTSSPSSSTTARSHGSLRCMSLGFLLRDRGDAVIWRGPKKTAMVRQFLTDVLWGETDYLLIDTPPGTSDEHIALAEQLLTLRQQQQGGNNSNGESSSGGDGGTQLAGAVLVTTPQAISTSDVRKELNFCAKTNIPVLGVVENMSGYMCPCCGEVSNVFSRGGGQVMAEEMGVNFMGAVPIDAGFGEMVEGWRSDIAATRSNTDDPADQKRGQRDEISSQKDMLVDRYQRCWSLSVFENFAKTMLGSVEGASDRT